MLWVNTPGILVASTKPLRWQLLPIVNVFRRGFLRSRKYQAPAMAAREVSAVMIRLGYERHRQH